MLHSKTEDSDAETEGFPKTGLVTLSDGFPPYRLRGFNKRELARYEA